MAIQRKKTGKSAKKATRGKASKGAGAIDEADLKRELIHSLASYLLGFASRSAAGESYVVGPIEMGRLDDRSRLAVDFSYRVTPDGRLALVDRMPLDTYMQSKSSEIWHHGGARAEAQLSDRTSATSPAPDAERHVSLPLLANLSTRLAPSSAKDLAELRSAYIGMDTALDPRLQLAMLNRQAGKPSSATASTTADEVAVVARVTDPVAWSEAEDVRGGARVGAEATGEHIVTGRIPTRRIVDVRRLPFVLSLKASHPVRGSLDATMKQMAVAPAVLGANFPDGGAGVVVGIVDFGGDFAHQNFRNNDGSTRLLALWHQAGAARQGSPLRYGRVYLTEEINRALSSHNPYASLGYKPDAEAHGTHVMDIAAGNGHGTGIPGVAPRADLIFVDASASDVAWEGPERVPQHFGDSVQVLEAVRWIFDEAGKRPCVVNLSLGTNGGPHDGTSLVERGLDALVNEAPNRAIVIAAGNANEDGVHAMGTLKAGGDHHLQWRVDKKSECELELWYAGAGSLTAMLIAPDGTELLVVRPGESHSLFDPAERPAVFVASRLDDPSNHDNVVGVWLAAGLPTGVWSLRLISESPQAIDFHAWIEREAPTQQASFLHPTASHLLGSISTGHQTLVVGSFDAHKRALPVSRFSSSGPTRDGREKPELSAPGHNVMAAGSLTGNGLITMSGTSMAAPAVAGLAALVLAGAARRGQSLMASDVRDRILANLDGKSAWDAQRGAGHASGNAV